MVRRGACYFCGADDRLRTVSITQRDRRDDPDAAVSETLCRSCERKLERVLGGLFDHVESGQATTGDDPAGSATEDDRGEPVDHIDVSSDQEAGRTGRQGRRRLFSDDEGSHPTDTTDAAAPSADAADDPEAEGTDDAEILDDEPRVRARATTTSGGPLDGVSVDEYNRVIRLLQNREFPMAREAFVDLAASAYDLAEETVQAVIDSVIDQGTLAERGGALVRPDEDAP